MKIDIFKKLRFTKGWLIGLPFLVYVFFGFQHLAQFETADEHLWLYNTIHGRIHDYWDAVADQKWKKTKVNDKPGITLAYVSGTSLLFQGDPYKRIIEKGTAFFRFDPDFVLRENIKFRLPILIFNGLFASLFFYWALKRLTGSRWQSLLAVTFILLSPIIIGMSQIVNPDSLMWIFAFASVLSFLNFLKHDRARDAVLSSVFLGLALLSKYTAVILIPFFSVVFVAYLLWSVEPEDPIDLKKKITRGIFAYFAIIAGACALFALLLPAALFSMKLFLSGTIGHQGMLPYFFATVVLFGLLLIDAYVFKSVVMQKILVAGPFFRRFIPRAVYALLAFMLVLILVNWSIGNNFLQIPQLNFDSARSGFFTQLPLWQRGLLEMYTLVFSLSPWVLIGLLAVWIFGFFRKRANEFFIFVLSLLMLVFYAAVISQGLLVHIRYSMMIYPVALALSALGWWELLQWSRWKIIHQILLFFCFVVLLSASIYQIKPFYFNYTSDLLPKNYMITGAWGYGGYEAAQILNAKPDAKNLTVWTDYGGFCPFFVGRCVKVKDIAKFVKEDMHKKYPIDYVVRTRRGKFLMGGSRTVNNEVKEWTKDLAPIWRLEIDNRSGNYVEIYPTHQAQATPKND